jgi:hypothetical protein
MGRIFTGRLQMYGRGPERRPGIAHPLFLLADSQLLFWAQRGELFLERARERIEADAPRAACLVAASAAQPDLFALVAGALEGVGIHQCRMIPAHPTDEDRAYLESAHLLLLGDGDLARGCRALEGNGVGALVARRYAGGAVLVGVGAGAVLLGVAARAGEAELAPLGLVPFAVDVRAEADDWPALRDQVRAREGAGLGIPRGGGLIYHPDHRVEAVRFPVCELAWQGGAVSTSLVLPG